MSRPCKICTNSPSASLATAWLALATLVARTCEAGMCKTRKGGSEQWPTQRRVGGEGEERPSLPGRGAEFLKTLINPNSFLQQLYSVVSIFKWEIPIFHSNPPPSPSSCHISASGTGRYFNKNMNCVSGHRQDNDPGDIFSFQGLISTANHPLEKLIPILERELPQYIIVGETISGHENILGWKQLTGILHMTLPITPIYVGILILRRRITGMLSTDKMSEHTRKTHSQLLKVRSYSSSGWRS